LFFQQCTSSSGYQGNPQVYASLHIDAALSADKINLSNKSCFCFYRNNVRYQNLQQLFEVQSFGLDTSRFNTVVLLLVWADCPVDSRPTLFEVSPELSVRVCQIAVVVMETMQLVLNQF